MEHLLLAGAREAPVQPLVKLLLEGLDDKGRLSWEAWSGSLSTERGKEALAAWAPTPQAARVWAEESDLGPGALEALAVTFGDPALAQPGVALALGRLAHRGLMEKSKSPSEEALLDLTLAEQLLAAGKGPEAASLLEARLPKLPDEALADLLPPEEADLTHGGGGQVLRVHLWTLLAQARAGSEGRDPGALVELARLQPLVDERLRAVAGPLAERALGLAELLQGSLPPQEGEAEEPIRALSSYVLESTIQHPATQAGGTMDALQGWLGKARLPDYGSIRAYAERLSAAAHPALWHAVADAVVLLGLPSQLEVYISRGERSVGVQVHEGEPPFLMVGADHLAEGGEFSMTPLELRFAIGAELAHLRFQHTRLSASEVWDGVFDKSSQMIDVAVALLGPLGLLGKALTTVSSVQQVTRVGSFLQRQLSWVQTGVEGAASVVGASKELRGKSSKGSAPPVSEVSSQRSELLAFCRVLQLTADRVGLLLCGDVSAATRGVLLTSRRHRSVLTLAQRHGLSTALSRKDGEGKLFEQDLAVRLAALYSFYLSEDFLRLRALVAG